MAMEAMPAGATETNGATNTNPSTRNFSYRLSEPPYTPTSPHRTRPKNVTLGHFVCFSCQFVVNDEQDYKAHFTDPDTLVNWDCVQQVVSALMKHHNFNVCSTRAISHSI